MSIATKLTTLANTKAAIKAAIEAKGQDLEGIDFSGYAPKIEAISGGSVTPSPEPYVRPADWLTLPTVLETDQKFVGLHAIYPDANFLALSAAGDYTVDWGDGVVENFASGAVAQHEYDYATYDVANATLCSRGYKQAIVVVTPQAGQTLTVLNLHCRHNALSSSYASGFLDIAIAGSSITDLRIGAQTPGAVTQTINFNRLEQVSILSSDIRTCERLFSACRCLRSIVSMVTSSTPATTLSATLAPSTVTSAGHGRRNGDTVILMSLVTTTGITVGSRYFVINATADTFQLSTGYGGSAVTLTGAGSGTFAAGTSMGTMFLTCSSLTTVPLFNTQSVTTMAGMFNACSSLTTVPLFNTQSVTTMSAMFYNCSSLTTVPLFNTQSVTTMAGMFSDAQSLTTVPAFNTASATNMSNMFNTCPSLSDVNMTGTRITHSFASCKLSAARLNEIYTNLAVVGNGAVTFQVAADTVTKTSHGLTVGAPVSFTGITGTTNIDNSAVYYVINPTANTFQLATTVGGAVRDLTGVDGTGNFAETTITVSNNYGTAADDPSIATAKGWTVTG